jgi:hypothetical protein
VPPKYKTLGHTPSGIEVQKNELGQTRLCRGLNIIADEAMRRYQIGDVTMEWNEDEEWYDFNYTLLCEGD